MKIFYRKYYFYICNKSIWYPFTTVKDHFEVPFSLSKIHLLFVNGVPLYGHTVWCIPLSYVLVGMTPSLLGTLIRFYSGLRTYECHIFTVTSTRGKISTSSSLRIDLLDSGFSVWVEEGNGGNDGTIPS